MKNLKFIFVALFLLVLAVPSWSQASKKDADFVNGKKFYQLEDYENARYYLLKTVADFPDNQEALYMLLNIEERTGHYPTAIVHVNELLSFNPYSVSLWKKKISLYRLIGDDVEADRLLERICLIYPENEELQRQKAGREEEKYLAGRKSGDVSAQIEYLRRAIASPQTPDLLQKYLELSNLLQRSGQNAESMEVLNAALTKYPSNIQLIRKKAGMLMDEGKTSEAYFFVRGKCNRINNPALETLLQDIEDEILIQAQLGDPYVVNGKLWESRQSEEALHYLISNSINKGYLDDAQYYLLEARKLYGDTTELLYKSYIVEKRLGNDAKAMQYLRRIHAADPDNQEVTDLMAAAALAEAKELMDELQYPQAKVLLDSVVAMKPEDDIAAVANFRLTVCDEFLRTKQTNAQLEIWEKRVAELSAQHKSEEVIAVADSALAVNPNLEMVQYYKGMALERLHRWDEAYECLKTYKPSPLEVSGHKRYLNSILSQKNRNTLTFEYQQARLGAEDVLTSNAGVTYAYRFKKGHVFTTGLKYTARDTEIIVLDPETGEGQVARSDDGGVGLQLSAAYRHKFTDKFSAELSAAGSNRYFPLATAVLSADWNLPQDWSLTVKGSYRLVNSFFYDDEDFLVKSKAHMFNVGASCLKDFGQVNLGVGTDLFVIKNKVFFNASGKVQYYPLEHSRSHVYAAIGAGTAPEIEIIDNSLPIGLSSLNTFVSAGGFISMTSHLGVSLSGSWYNLSNTKGAHKNYFYVNAMLQVSF